ncbi:MAG: hypothetical protein AB7E05_04930 [Sphingobium sp.]
MKLRFLAPALPFCLLAACSSQDGDKANDGTNLSAPIVDNHADDADAQAGPDNSAASVNAAAADAQEQVQDKDQMPLALRGRWGLVPKDCTSTMGDNKGLLVISGTTLTFYESRGTLKSFTQWAPDRIRAHFDFSGEGMNWAQDMALELQQDDKTLVRRDHGDEAQTGPLRYQKCPA